MAEDLTFPITSRNRVTRAPHLAHQERALIHEILDAGVVCHVGYVRDEVPYVTPTAYWRDGDDLYWHGSSASPMLRTLADVVEVCVTVTHVDGLVLARSAYHHTMNFRSVMAFGRATVVREDDEKIAALRAFAEWILPGRWGETRPPSAQELKATVVMRMPLEIVSAKVRSGPAIDEASDYALPFWAGVIPLTISPGAPQPDERLLEGVTVPPGLLNRIRGCARQSEPSSATGSVGA